MKNKKIFIAGAGGMLGDALYHLLCNNNDVICTDIDLNSKWLTYLDFRDYSSYLKAVTSFKPDYLFHIGAITDLEYCELNVDDAYKTNTLSTEFGTRIANKLDIPIVYISTAGIFDGSQSDYDDWSEPRPISHYGRSKFFGERYVVENAARYVVCRAGWMMGGGPKKDKKFVKKVMDQLDRGTGVIYAVDDRAGTPTYTYDFAVNLLTVLASEAWGLYNLTGDGSASRFDVASEIVSLLNLNNRVEVRRVDSEFFSGTYFARRPQSEVLLCRKLRLLDMYQMRDWRVTLAEYLNGYRNDSY